MPLDRDAIDVVPEQAASEVPPGADVTEKIAVVNSANFIPQDEPRVCSTFNQEDGVGIQLTGTRSADPAGMGEPVELYERDFCLGAGSSVTETVTFTAPSSPGEYTVSYTAGSRPGEPAQVWGNYTHTITVTDGSGVSGGPNIPGILAVGAVGLLGYRQLKGGENE